MSMPDPAAAPADDSASQRPAASDEVSDRAATEVSDRAAAPTSAEAPTETDEAPAIVEETAREVTLQRSVRVGRVVVGAAIAGALIAALVALLFPVEEGAEYTLGQVTGFASLIGAAIGLAVGGILVMVLGAVAKRQHGTGVAIQSDVR